MNIENRLWPNCGNHWEFAVHTRNIQFSFSIGVKCLTVIGILMIIIVHRIWEYNKKKMEAESGVGMKIKSNILIMFIE